MNLEELKTAVLALDTEEKKAFILETVPDLAKEAMQTPGFLMQLLPVFMNILKESGVDMQQLLQLATMLSNKTESQE